MNLVVVVAKKCDRDDHRGQGDGSNRQGPHGHQSLLHEHAGRLVIALVRCLGNDRERMRGRLAKPMHVARSHRDVDDPRLARFGC